MPTPTQRPHRPAHLDFALALAGVLIASSVCAAEPMEVEKAPPTSAGIKLPASITELFAKIDKDQDGRLSKDEAKALPAVAERFDELDKNKDGYLSLEEFALAIKPDAAK